VKARPKAFVVCPGRAKPKGASDSCGAKPTDGYSGLRAGTKPRNRGLTGRLDPDLSGLGTTPG
jgi:hypothetical protein